MQRIFCIIFILLIAVCSEAQSIGEYTEGVIDFNGKNKTGISTLIDADSEQITKAWQKYVVKNFNFQLNQSLETYQAQEVKIPKITNRTADLVSLIESVDENQTRMSIAISFGYDITINSREYPEEYDRMKLFLSDFVNQFYTDFYNKLLYKKKLALKVAEQELEAIEVSAGIGTTDPNVLVIENAQTNIEKLKLTSEEKKAIVKEKQENIQELKKEIGAIYQNAKTFNKSPNLKFKRDRIEDRGRVKNALTGYTDLKPEKVVQAWTRYVQLNLLVDVKKTSPKHYEATEVQLAGIADKYADFTAIIEDFAGGTKMSVAVSLGYEIFLNDKDYPKEFNSLNKFLKKFASQINKLSGDEILSTADDAKLDELILKVARAVGDLDSAKLALEEVKKDSLEAEQLIYLLKKNKDLSQKLGTSRKSIKDKQKEIVKLEFEIEEIEKKLFSVSKQSSSSVNSHQSSVISEKTNYIQRNNSNSTTTRKQTNPAVKNPVQRNNSNSTTTRKQTNPVVKNPVQRNNSNSTTTRKQTNPVVKNPVQRNNSNSTTTREQSNPTRKNSGSNGELDYAANRKSSSKTITGGTRTNNRGSRTITGGTNGSSNTTKKATPKNSNPKKETRVFITYTVKRGDTMATIAQAHKMSIRTLKHINGLKTNQLYIGDKLTVIKPSKN